MVTPCLGDFVQITEDINSDDATIRILLQKGIRGKIMRVGEDGDLEIFFPTFMHGCHSSFPRWFATRWVMKDKVEHMLRLFDPEYEPRDEYKSVMAPPTPEGR
jgi:hypothetical protein